MRVNRSATSAWKGEFGIFVLAAFAVSWVGGFVWVVVISSTVSRAGFFAQAYVTTIPVVLGPALAAVAITARQTGEALIELLRLVRPRAGHWYWYVGLPVAGFALAALSFMMAGVPTSTLARAAGVTGAGWLVAHLGMQILVVGVGEELGWRGWLLPHLARRFTFRVATAVTIVIWEAWHLPKLLGGWAVGTTLTVQIMATGVILSWLWIRVAGNVLVLAVAHGAVNAPIFVAEHLLGITPDELITGWRWYAGGLCLIGLGLTPAVWRQGRPPVRSVT